MSAIPNLGQPNPSAPLADRVAWLERSMQLVLAASQADPAEIADAYVIDNAPALPFRVFDASTATLADVRNVIATWINDWRQRGTSRGTG